MQPNNEYDPFARIYNKYWGGEYRRGAIPVIERLLLAVLKPRACVLDVCCGTGQIAAHVIRKGFAVAGIDGSAAMLGYARENAPTAGLHVAHVRNFDLRRQFDGAYSVFESLNHVPDMRGLGRAFRNVRKHLKPGAPFLFDLNSEEAFELYWNTVDALVEDDMTCVLRMNYDSDSMQGTCEFTAFELADGVWTRNDFTIQQKCHAKTDVLRALNRAGFKDVTLYAATDAGIRDHTGYGRMFFLAR